MRYVLRADASPFIGAGHVMRSSAIAEELIARGQDVIFIGHIVNLPWVEERIATLGFSQIYSTSKEFFPSAESDILLLDSYEIELDDSFIALSNWLHVVAIVDALTPSYRCSLRIHPGLDSSWTGESSTPILAGPNYIPFRKALSQKIKTPNRGNEQLKIAVVAGGSDPYQLVLEVAKTLHHTPGDFEVYVFTNSSSESTLDARFHYVEIGAKLDELTQDVDLVLTTSSTSCLEFLARGLCVGVACSVDNQEQYYNSLGELGVAAQIGFRNIKNQWELDEERIHLLVSSVEFRSRLISRAAGLIDFKGAERIVDAIMAL